MKNAQTDENTGHGESMKNPLPEYVPPKVITYTSEEVLERIGPAQACSPQGAPGGGVLG